jgi:hypothetical protein
MSRRGLLPAAPESLQGQAIKVEYVSVLAQMQRMVGISQLEKTVGFIVSMAGTSADALDKLNIDEAIDEYASRAGAPPRILRSDQEVKAIREGRAQQQQMADLAALMPAAKDGTEALSNVAALGGMPALA